MTKIPGTLDSSQKQWAPGFPGIYFHMIHKYPRWAEVANYTTKKQLSGTKTSKGLQWGRAKGLEWRAIILEPWDLFPGGIFMILDTS